MNIKDESDKILYKADIITAYLPDIERPASYFTGSRGSSKSTATKISLDLVNPIDLNTDLLAWPDSKEDLMLALTDSAARAKLFVNGINLTGLSFTDLMDRMIVYDLETPEKQVTREEIFSRYEGIKPKILGAIFDCIVKAMNQIPEVRKQDIYWPRLAGFTMWGEALAQSCWEMEPGEFTAIYNEKRANLSQKTVSSDEFSGNLLKFAESELKEKLQPYWEGTPTDLLTKMNDFMTKKHSAFEVLA